MTFALIGVGFLYRSIFHALMNSTREFSRRVRLEFVSSWWWCKRENSFSSDFYSLLMNIFPVYWWHKQDLGKHKLGSIVRPPSAWWFQRSLLLSLFILPRSFFSAFSWQWQQPTLNKPAGSTDWSSAGEKGGRIIHYPIDYYTFMHCVECLHNKMNYLNYYYWP